MWRNASPWVVRARLVVLVTFAAVVEAKRKKNLQKSPWQPIILLGIIFACITLPLVVMLVWRVATDPAFPLIVRELYYRLLECCCDDGTWRAKRRRRARRDADESVTFGDPNDELEDEERRQAELRARRVRRERRHNLEKLADEVLADDLRRAVEEAAAAPN